MLDRVCGIIPCHDHARWLAGCILAMARQGVPPGLIVVVDDGSSDGSSRVARETAAEHGLDVHVIFHPRARGPAAARNAGADFALSRGFGVFAFCDSDDLYLPGKMELSLRELRPGVGAVYSDFETESPSGEFARHHKGPYSRELLLRECVVNCDSLVTAEAFLYAGGFREDMRVCEDYHLWVALSERFAIVHVDAPLVRIRTGPHSSSATVARARWESDYAKVMERARRGPLLEGGAF